MRYLSAHTVTSGFFLFYCRRLFICIGVAGILQFVATSWILELPKDKDSKMMATRNPKVSPKRKVSKPKAHESSLSKDQGEVEIRLHGERLFDVWLFALVLF